MADYTLIVQGGTIRITLPKGTNWTELILGTAVTVLFTKDSSTGSHPFHQRRWHFYDHMLMYVGFGFVLSLASFTFLWLWTLLGEQILTFDGITLVHRREILGIGFSREYDWSAVQDFRLRVQAAPQNIPSSSAAARFVFNVRDAAVMAFDYGARTDELGCGLDRSSASELVTRIYRLFPSTAVPAVNT